ncbi:MAG: DUF3616 domain-containing protein [Enhydrobacter sp.]|nr:DUF3616 domain-containing protein [Enhydrobacter sp.]
MIRPIVILLFCLASTVAAAQGKLLEFRGICDASGAVALDENRIVVGDDEKAFLSIYRLDDQSREPPIQLPAAIAGSDAKAEADIEAATIFQGRIVWITSHGRDKNGEVERDRSQLFASHRRSADGAPWQQDFSTPSRGLLGSIQSTGPSYEVLNKAIGDLSQTIERLAPKKKGFNIEAMTADKDGKLLLVGLRNPQENKDAIVFEITNAQDVLDGREKPKLGRVLPVDLEGRGLRDMAWSPAHGAYLIAAGQVDDEVAGPGFAIFSWSGSDRKTTRLSAFDSILAAHRDFHPEAIVPLLERQDGRLIPSKRVLLISDDGTKELASGKKCKKADKEQKSFRGVILPIN